MKWYEEPMVISAVQCNYHEDSFEILREHTVGHHFNTEQLLHLCAEGHMGYYIESRDGAKLSAYLEESRKAGIREIIYYNIHCITPQMQTEHPDWLVRDAKGEKISIYDTFALNCVNESYTENFLTQIRALCTHDIDGIFLDGPIIMGGCHCQYCKKEFLEKFGKDIDSATPAELLKFNVSKGVRFMKTTYETIKSINPNIIVYLNNSALRADVTGNNTRQIAPYVDMLGSEGGFVWVNRSTSNWHVTPMAKLIETQAEGKPCVTFIAGDSKPWSYYMHTAEETTLYYAQAVANGTNVWYGIHGPIPQVNTAGGRASTAFNKFILDNKPIYTRHKPVSKVALLWSQDSANYYQSSVGVTDFTNAQIAGKKDGVKGDHYKSFMGFFEILVRNHIQHDVIDEVSITKGDLSKYDVLVMPTAACLSDDAAEKIHEYVKNGGNLITSYDSGFYNENGDMANEPKLADIQGIKSVCGFVEYKGAGQGYQRAVGESEYMKDESWKLTPSTDIAVEVEPTSDANVCAEFTRPMAGRYTALREEYYPSVIENKYGLGKSVYFAGAVGEFFTAFSNPDYKRMVNNAVVSMADAIVVTDAPGSVEMVLRKCEQGYALHAINFTGEMERPISRIIELSNIKVELHINDISGDVFSITGAQPENIVKTCDTISFTIPSMKEYEVITIK